MKKAVLLFMILVVGLIAGCGGNSEEISGSPSGKAVRIAVSPWVASEINAEVAKIIIEDNLGISVETVAIDEYSQWDLLANGSLDACLEIWPSGHGDNIKSYIGTGKVENGGLLGPIGKIGWYIPSYLRNQIPELSSWQGLKDSSNAALFSTDSPNGRGVFLMGDDTWVSYEKDIIKNLGLNFEVVYVGSEEALLEEVDKAYDQKSPVIFYLWTPHWAHVLYDLVPVNLPPYSEQCYSRAETGGVDCDYPSDMLFKVFNLGLKSEHPEVYSLLKNMRYTNSDQISMLAAVQLESKTAKEAARDWVDKNKDIWNGWLGE